MIDTLQIAQLGNEVLRRQAETVDDFNDPKFQQLINTLHEMMLTANGVGIAAPQVGISRQIVIIASRPTARYPNAPEMQPVEMINPAFKVLDDTLRKDWEGCLSVPGIRAQVPRYQSIQVSYQTRQGEFREQMLEDFPARVFQHEFDHLQGLVFLDRVENNRDIVTESEFMKLIVA